MQIDKLVELLETYSNAILGFVVLQSVAVAFTYGTNARFSCLVNNEPWLAPGLIVHLILCALLACVAIWILSRTVHRVLNGEEPAARILSNLYWAKALIIVLFVAVPVFAIAMYGTAESKDPARCNATKEK